MVDALLAYLMVAAATGWTAWSLILRGWLQRRRAARRPPGGSDANCGPDCSCG